MIECRDITKSFGQLQVLKGVSIGVSKGGVVAIVGPSGAGKTTLLQIIGTLSSADGGELSINNRSLHDLNDNQLADFRNSSIGFVFQFHHLLPEFTALENISIPAMIAGLSKSEAEVKARELAVMLGLESRLSHKPAALSGGEQQRVAIARALINNPAVLLADEPTGNLDSKNRDEIHRLFFDLRDKLGQTIVVVTHDEGLAAMADRKIVLKDGIVDE